MECLTNFLENTFSIDDNTSATIIITLTVFILGYIIMGLAKSISAYINRIKYRNLFKEMINEIARCAEIQSDNINKLIGTINIANNGYFNLKKQNINLLNNFNQISFESFYGAYFKGIENLFNRKKIIYFNKTFGIIDALTKNEIQILIELDKCVNNFNKHADNWNDSTEKVKLSIEDMNLYLDGQDVPIYVAEFFQQIDKLISDWQKFENPTRYDIVYNNLIKPIIKLYNENKHVDLVKISKSLLDRLMDSEYNYQSMCKSLEFYRELFSNFESRYKQTSEILLENNNILN